ncbi:MAG: Tetraacyldisaccharide 4'-kinase [Planctomycetes bacterium ADurb.Bin126]|nr:MAG: Tetraacyldisaccharide 4'-kinase [Planctomycetes bacterium ADurb.Bin126]HOD82742.1 tetraacyldisaccharide 4'-kinase [Phycisphaerae bacterium]HQL73377.1 tetraacyldisaccharide 4'-kinase [Phycisphaerae bacterium]
MREQTIRDILSGQRSGAGASLLRAALWLACWPYKGAMCLRRCAYRRGWLKSHPAGVPVICVGNLSTGGTGKTPMVAWIVHRLREMGRLPAILSRGYKAVNGRSDEADLLSELCGVPVVIDANRQVGAQKARENGADVLVMDDGFQHRRLRRDLDIVLIDATNPLGYGYCLPRGLLREGPSALSDAGLVVLTHSDQVNAQALRDLCHRLACHTRAPILQAVHRPTHLIDEGGRVLPLELLAGRKMFAFCGLANPDRFFAQLGGLHARLVGATALDDHQPYTDALLAELKDSAASAGVSLLITTQKDHMRLRGLDHGMTIWQLAVEMDLGEGQELMVEKLKGAVNGPTTRTNDARTNVQSSANTPMI